MKNFSESIIDRLVGLTILLFFLVIIAFMITGGCGGGSGGGNGDKEFTVFDVTIRVLEVESQNGPTDCPESANLKMSLLINGNNISGFAELLGLGKIGESRAISGVIEDNEFTLEPFSVSVSGDVPPDAFFPASSISFDFQQFQGVFMDDDEDGVVDRMEGEVSGKVFEGQGDVIVCFDTEFTGEFSGISRSPEGCVSRRELPTFECLTEGLIILCSDSSSSENYGGYFCPGDCDEITGLCFDYALYPSGCEVVDCVSLSSCDGIPDVTNLRVNDLGRVYGNLGTPDNVGEPFYCY